ncbi:hypothetical protein [Catenovulum maritimum]|uniref:hypothetical protein n=1 Tax=Catenovulum maritimum TaxID=1513271 RepID=UPI00155B120D|nr:hypothetical protein [Catenovulum maritimum]
MNINFNVKASEKALEIQKSLQTAVNKELDKKKKLGQYAVVWDEKTQTIKRI